MLLNNARHDTSSVVLIIIIVVVVIVVLVVVIALRHYLAYYIMEKGDIELEKGGNAERTLTYTERKESEGLVIPGYSSSRPERVEKYTPTTSSTTHMPPNSEAAL